MKICIVGAGSIGKRHIENLVEFKGRHSIQVIEPDISKWTNIGASYITAHLYDLDKSDGAIICTPTHLHAECALPFLKQGIPVLIEKPLSHDLKSAILLAPYHQLIRVGYTMRYHPAMEFISRHLSEIGTPYYIQAEVGQYLPDWHPDEDYRNWYMAHKDQGGGAALDLSHEIDTVQWLMNSIISNATGFSVHVSDLEIDSDDLTMIQGRLLNGVRFQINQNLLDRTYNRKLRIVGSKQTVSWEDPGHLVRIGNLEYDLRLPESSELVSFFDIRSLDRNAQFLLEEREFIRWIQHQTLETKLTEYDRAFHTLEVAIGIRDQGRFSFDSPNAEVNLKKLSWSPRDE